MPQYSSSSTAQPSGAVVNAVLNSSAGTITYTVTNPKGLSAVVTLPTTQNPQDVATLNDIRRQLAEQNGGSGLGLNINGFGESLNTTFVTANNNAKQAQTIAIATNSAVPDAPSPPPPAAPAPVTPTESVASVSPSQVPVQGAVDQNFIDANLVLPSVTKTGTTTGTTTPVDTSTTAQAAANLLVQTDDEDKNLQNIVGAQGEIVRAEDNIQNNNRQISDNEQAQAAAQEQQRQAQAFIDENNAQLADDDLPDDRRAELEANNAAQRASIAENAAVIDEAQANIDSATANNEQQTDSIITNQGVIGENSEAFTANGSEIGAPVVADNDPFEARRLELEREADEQEETRAAADVDTTSDQGLPQDDGTTQGIQDQINDQDAAVQNAAKTEALNQATLQSRLNQPSSADWRVRLSLGPGSNYLYNAPSAQGKNSTDILAPLFRTNGVIFPYTPTIETSYQAKYQTSDLTHSNYRGYFYQNSYINDVNIRGVFTAQDTKEAEYLLATIHFFRSVTKMFYGKDAEAGTPPPLVYLSGFGQFQYNNHPCLVTAFNYSLPSDVDYIRANGFNNFGLNLENRRNQSSGPAPGGGLGGVFGAISRLTNSGLAGGSLTQTPSPSNVNQQVNNTNPTNSTYVPTKMEISITLLPVQSRKQISQQFSLKSFASGDLLKGGFW